jgi:hypothetical protein
MRRGRLAPLRLAVASVSPDAVRLVWGSGRTHAAPAWRKLVRLSVVLLGFAIFGALEYELAILIQAEDWFHIGMIFVGIITLIATLFSVPAAFIGWLVLSPWVALFWREAVGGALGLSFDRVMVLLLLIVVTVRRLAKRERLRPLLLPEVLLLASFVYIKVVPRIGDIPTMIWGMNVALDSLVSPFIIYWVARECITNKKQIPGMLVAVLIGGLAWALSGFFEHYFGKMWLSPIIGEDIRLTWGDVAQGRATGPANHYYVYGGVLILTIFLGLHLGASAKRSGARFLYLVTTVLTVVALYFGYSRAPYLAFGISLLIATLLVKRGRGLYATAAVAVFILGTIAMSSLSTSTQTERFGTRNVVGLSGRSAINKTMLNMIGGHFWFGVGYQKSPDAMSEYVSSMAHGHWVKRHQIVYSHAHNEALLIFAEQGIVGFVIYFGALIAFVFQIFRVRARLPDAGVLGKDFVLPAFLLILSYFIMGSADQFQISPYLYFLMYSMIAIVMQLGYLTDQEAKQDSNRVTDQQDAPDAQLSLAPSGSNR